MRIAIQGELGSFSHEAALRLEAGATIVPCSVSAQVFDRLVQGDVDAAVIPIENSLAGPVAEHYDLLLASAVAIAGESLLRIRHNLIAAPNSLNSTASDDERRSQLRRVYSHPIALAQCRRYFVKHPHLQAVPAYDTAGSVKRLMEAPNASEAAIASLQAARQFGGQVLDESIEDDPENYTRFFLVRRTADIIPVPDADKVSLAFSVENLPGSLVAALAIFAEHGTNLTKIESRPVQGKPWEYIFYVDFQVPAASTADIVLAWLRARCSMVKELGRYRSASSPGHPNIAS